MVQRLLDEVMPELDGEALGEAPGETEATASSVVALELDAAGRLWLRRGELSRPVVPVRCFPWSAPSELLSLRDENDTELLFLEQPDQLDPASARALELALATAAFVLEVERVLSIEEDQEIRIWKTQTRQGRRILQTRLDEWPWPSPDGGHLMRDLAGDLFRLPPLETLDEHSQRVLWAYVG
jgi:hypothetical protein